MKKLVLIGCGGIGAYHLEHLVQFKDIELAGFCDLLLDRAEDFALRAGGGKAYTDFITMYDETQPDMVFICVPPTCHGKIEFETIRRGIPFFVEKPLALDLSLAKELVRQVDAKGLIAASGFQCRYDNINDTAREFIQEHPILHVAASCVGGIPDAPWWNVKSTSGGQLVEQTIHQLDMLRYLLQSEPDTVYSVASRGYITQEESPGYFTDDLSTTLITFQNGVTCTMMTGCYSLNGAAWDSKMTFGSRSARMDYHLCEKVSLFGVNEADKTSETQGTIAGDGTQRKSENEVGVTVKNQIDFGLTCDRTFVDAVLTGDASRVRSPYRDAYKSVAFALACNKSMESGQPVKVVY
ncbi:Gfo/Idh/MocA family protein [Acutalibacter muris]|uniref:Gfo/Idh/MocA family protein n=1 Tax=Acutalibacter muris TaxID=1796620 RepID=UPI001C3EB22B|nr:Gfo/Idh/MocA family oxidoreductase [Acutalibacter muris]